MLPIIISVVIALIIIVILLNSYKKVGPNQVLFITGAFLHHQVKVIKGGGAFVWPVLQQAQIQSLDTFNIDVSVEDIMTKTQVPVDVKATALLRVGSSVDMLATAAEKILGLAAEERDQQLTEIVKGGVREVLTSLTPQEANDRQQFQEEIVKSIEETFSNLGLEITKLTITSISDKNGYYESLYTKDVEDKKSDARIATAQADRRAALAEADNLKQKQAAQLAAEKDIAASQRDTEVAKAKYQAEVNQQQAIAEKVKEITSAEQQAIVEQKNAEVNRQQQQATTIVKANADAQQMEIMANAHSKKQAIDADADVNQRKKLADADAYATKQAGEAEADKVTKIGEANAKAQKAMQDALNSEQGQAAMKMALIKILPELVTASTQGLTNAQHVTVFNGADGVNQLGEAGLAQGLKFVKDATGLDLVDNLNKQADGKRTVTGNLAVDQSGNKDNVGPGADNE